MIIFFRPQNMSIFSDAFYNYLNTHCLSCISATPSQLASFDFKRLNTLKTVISGGETFQKSHFDHIRNGFDGLLINSYGPTEATIVTHIETFLQNDTFVNSIGKPMINIHFYVLDELLRPVPQGAIGELYLSGNCLARGYLNRPEETNKSFVMNPFISDEERKRFCDNRMYKTGDLVRWSYRNKLEYIGRNDLQVSYFFGFN